MYLGKIVEIADRDSCTSRRCTRTRRPCCRRCRCRTRSGATQARADPAHGRRAQPDQPAAGLPVPHPLLEGAGDLPDDRAAAASSCAPGTRSPATSRRTPRRGATPRPRSPSRRPDTSHLPGPNDGRSAGCNDSAPSGRRIRPYFGSRPRTGASLGAHARTRVGGEPRTGGTRPRTAAGWGAPAGTVASWGAPAHRGELGRARAPWRVGGAPAHRGELEARGTRPAPRGGAGRRTTPAEHLLRGDRLEHVEPDGADRRQHGGDHPGEGGDDEHGDDQSARGSASVSRGPDCEGRAAARCRYRARAPFRGRRRTGPWRRPRW